jgi:hypothetical protein
LRFKSEVKPLLDPIGEYNHRLEQLVKGGLSTADARKQLEVKKPALVLARDSQIILQRRVTKPALRYGQLAALRDGASVQSSQWSKPTVGSKLQSANGNGVRFALNGRQAPYANPRIEAIGYASSPRI